MTKPTEQAIRHVLSRYEQMIPETSVFGLALNEIREPETLRLILAKAINDYQRELFKDDEDTLKLLEP